MSAEKEEREGEEWLGANEEWAWLNSSSELSGFGALVLPLPSNASIGDDSMDEAIAGADATDGDNPSPIESTSVSD